MVIVSDEYIVSMPELIAQTNMDYQAVNRLREELSQMTTWLAKDTQVNTFFASVYESPRQAYSQVQHLGLSLASAISHPLTHCFTGSCIVSRGPSISGAPRRLIARSGCQHGLHQHSEGRLLAFTYNTDQVYVHISTSVLVTHSRS
jgi:hypothetical protein